MKSLRSKLRKNKLFFIYSMSHLLLILHKMLSNMLNETFELHKNLSRILSIIRVAITKKDEVISVF